MTVFSIDEIEISEYIRNSIGIWAFEVLHEMCGGTPTYSRLCQLCDAIKGNEKFVHNEANDSLMLEVNIEGNVHSLEIPKGHWKIRGRWF